MSWRAKTRLQQPVRFESSSTLIVLAVLISMVLVFAQEWMLLLVIAAGVFFYYAWNRLPADEGDFGLTNFGVKAFGKNYDWGMFTRWWKEEKRDSKVLVLELKQGWVNRLYLPIGEVKESDVDTVVRRFLVEDKPQETALDKAGKWFTAKFPLENKI